MFPRCYQQVVVVYQLHTNRGYALSESPGRYHLPSVLDKQQASLGSTHTREMYTPAEQLSKENTKQSELVE